MANEDKTIIRLSSNPNCKTITGIAYLQTTTSANGTILRVPVEQNTAIVVAVEIAGAEDDYSAGCGGSIVGVFRRGTGSMDGVGVDINSLEDDSLVDPSISMSEDSNDVVVLVASGENEVWNWVCHYRITVLDV